MREVGRWDGRKGIVKNIDVKNVDPENKNL